MPVSADEAWICLASPKAGQLQAGLLAIAPAAAHLPVAQNRPVLLAAASCRADRCPSAPFLLSTQRDFSMECLLLRLVAMSPTDCAAQLVQLLAGSPAASPLM